MTMEAISNTFASQGGIAACFNAMSAGDPFCATHGLGPCVCMSGDSTTVILTGIGTAASDTLTIALGTWTCPNCNMVVATGQYHACIYANPGVGTSGLPSINPMVNPCSPPLTFTLTPPPECAMCDKLLEIDDKKLCKECKGVIEVWKFLTKKAESEEGGSEG